MFHIVSHCFTVPFNSPGALRELAWPPKVTLKWALWAKTLSWRLIESSLQRICQRLCRPAVGQLTLQLRVNNTWGAIVLLDRKRHSTAMSMISKIIKVYQSHPIPPRTNWDAKRHPTSLIPKVVRLFDSKSPTEVCWRSPKVDSRQALPRASVASPLPVHQFSIWIHLGTS